MARIKWRKWNNILHRDIGYLAVGLTIIYAISGIAVNHVDQWNPNYSIVRESFRIRPVTATDKQQIVDQILTDLKIPTQPESTFRPTADRIQLFYTNLKIEVNLQTGSGFKEETKEKPLLYEFNYLHLNHAKKLWTYFADLYAVALLFLAISGIFVLKGRKGFAGRGKWLVGLGIVIPIAFLIAYL